MLTRAQIEEQLRRLRRLAGRCFLPAAERLRLAKIEVLERRLAARNER